MQYKFLTWYKNPQQEAKVVHVLEVNLHSSFADEAMAQFGHDVLKRARRGKVRHVTVEVLKRRHSTDEYKHVQSSSY